MSPSAQKSSPPTSSVQPRIMSSSLSDLPPDLIRLISTHLPTYTSFIRLRAVSRHLHTSLPQTPIHLRPQLPWLLLPHTLPTAPIRRAFLDLSLHKFHFLPSPLPSARHRCSGSSHGYLAFLDSSEISLLNPLTNHNLTLPPLSAFSNVVSLDFSNVGREYTLINKYGVLYTSNLSQMRDLFIKKIVLSDTPRNGNFTAVAILNQTGELSYFNNGGNQSWRIVNGVEGCEDVIHFNGLFYAVNKIGYVTVCDLSQSTPTVSVIESSGGGSGGDVHYLVRFESGNGGLLFVSRYLDVVYDDEFDQLDAMYKTVRFEVFGMDLGSGAWEKISSLGDKALFLGENSSICLIATEYDGCKGNCIYFTDDYSASNCDACWGDFDMGVYHLGDGSIESLVSCPRNSRNGSRWPPPIWVTPNPL